MNKEIHPQKFNYTNLEFLTANFFFKDKTVNIYNEATVLPVAPKNSNMSISATHFFSPVVQGYKNVRDYAKMNNYDVVVIKNVKLYNDIAKFNCDFYNLGAIEHLDASFTSKKQEYTYEDASSQLMEDVNFSVLNN